MNLELMKIAKESCPRYFGRTLVLTEFMENIMSSFDAGSTLKVAVLGGSAVEPELVALDKLGFKVDFTIFGIEENCEFLDLNQELLKKDASNFDLYLCSQVWEHIWNHGIAFRNIQDLMTSGSFLWLAAPASNRAHASPDYFCAGFTASYFVNNLNQCGLSVLSSGQLGTPRTYRATHTMPVWPTTKSHSFPFLYAFDGYKIGTRIALTLRYFVRNLELYLFSSRITSEDAFATESWVFARKT
jgi:hypothetical protein